MGNSLIWFLLSCKRQLRKTSFLAILLLLPFLLWAASKMGEKEEEGVRIALYAEEEMGLKTARRLMARPEAFNFYLSDSQEELKEDVKKGRAECGYVFPEKFQERLEKNDFRRSIELYSSPSTVLSTMSEEVVFSAVMEIYGPQILNRYTKSQSWDKEAIHGLYEKHLYDNSTFSFEYESVQGEEAEKNTLSMTFPVRGVGAVFLFLTGIFAASALAEDERKGLFLCISHGKKWWYIFLAVTASVGMAAAAVLVSLYLTGDGLEGVWGFIKEIWAMAVYTAGIGAFCTLLKKIAGKPEIIISLVPFFTIGSLGLCPVFVDAVRWIPGLEPVSRLFLPYYYLRFFIH